MDEEIRENLYNRLSSTGGLNSQIFFGRAAHEISPTYAIFEPVALEETKDTEITYVTVYLQLSIYDDAANNVSNVERISNDCKNRLDESERYWSAMSNHEIISIDCIKPTRIFPDPDYWIAITEYKLKLRTKKLQVDARDIISVGESIN